MSMPNLRSKALRLLVLSAALVPVQIICAELVSGAIPPDTIFYPMALIQDGRIGDLRHLIGISNFVHRVSLIQLLALQALCLLPAAAALAQVKWMSWYPVYVTPGIIANGAEGVLFGHIRNWVALPLGGDAWCALSVGDIWVYALLFFSVLFAAIKGVRRLTRLWHPAQSVPPRKQPVQPGDQP